MDYTHEEIVEMLGDLSATLNDAFGIVQSLTEYGKGGAGIERLLELHDMVESALDLSTEIFDGYGSV